MSWPKPRQSPVVFVFFISLRPLTRAKYYAGGAYSFGRLGPLLHHKANGLPYAAFVDDKVVRERGLRMVSHFDLLPYSDEKAIKMLSTQWKYHDPTGTYWTTVEECYTSMTVGHVPRIVLTTIANESEDSSGDGRAAPAIYDDLHNCIGWPPSDSWSVGGVKPLTDSSSGGSV